MMKKEIGRVASPPGHSAPPEPCGLGPSGECPSRMTDRSPFEEIASQAYGWVTDDDGFLWGLVAGDQGYEATDKKLCDLLDDGATAEWSNFYRTGRKVWPVHRATLELIEACRAAVAEDNASAMDAAEGGRDAQRLDPERDDSAVPKADALLHPNTPAPLGERERLNDLARALQRWGARGTEEEIEAVLADALLSQAGEEQARQRNTLTVEEIHGALNEIDRLQRELTEATQRAEAAERERDIEAAARRRIERQQYEHPWTVNEAAQERARAEAAEREVERLDAERRATLQCNLENIDRACAAESRIKVLEDLLRTADNAVIWEHTYARSGFQEEIEEALGIGRDRSALNSSHPKEERQ